MEREPVPVAAHAGNQEREHMLDPCKTQCVEQGRRVGNGKEEELNTVLTTAVLASNRQHFGMQTVQNLQVSRPFCSGASQEQPSASRKQRSRERKIDLVGL
jgi:hypothetical protein